MRTRLYRVLVAGPSMAPTLRDGDHVLVVRTTSARPGAVVVVALPDDRPLAVKRLVRIEADGTCWVEGDNPYGSTDSRTFGALPALAVQGVAIARLWPRPARLRRGKDYAD